MQDWFARDRYRRCDTGTKYASGCDSLTVQGVMFAVCETASGREARVSDRVQPATVDQGRGMAEWTSVLDAVNSVIEDLQKKAPRKTYGGTSLGESALGASGAGGHFRFPDVATAKKIIAKFEERMDSINKRQQLIEKAQRALESRFAEDPESVSYRDVAMNSLQRLYELNESMFTYTDNYIKKINKAIEAMHQLDDESARSLGGSARGVLA